VLDSQTDELLKGQGRQATLGLKLLLPEDRVVVIQLEENR